MSVRYEVGGGEISVINIPAPDQTEGEELLLCLQFPKAMPSVILKAMESRGMSDLEALLIWTEI